MLSSKPSIMRFPRASRIRLLRYIHHIVKLHTNLNGTTTLIETISVKLASTHGISLEFPSTATLPSNLAGWSVSTTYVFSFPSTIFNPPSTSKTASPSGNASSSSHTISSSSTSASPTSTHSSKSSSSSSSTTTSATRSTTSKLALCFDPTLQTPIPCSSTPSTTSSAYPVETTLHSGSSSSSPFRTFNIPNTYALISSLMLIYLFLSTDDPVQKLYIGILWTVNAAVVRMGMAYSARRRGVGETVVKEYGVEVLEYEDMGVLEKGIGWLERAGVVLGRVGRTVVVKPVIMGAGAVSSVWRDWMG
ncbi:MAG: hypothetical protein Q9201_007264 [Fulgogasparrea decipioides]